MPSVANRQVVLPGLKYSADIAVTLTQRLWVGAVCWWGQKDGDHLSVPLQKLVKCKYKSYRYLSALSKVNTCDLKIQIWKMSLFSLDSFLNLRKFKQYQSEKVQYFLHRLLQVAVNKQGQIQSHCWWTGPTSLQFLP